MCLQLQLDSFSVNAPSRRPAEAQENWPVVRHADQNRTQEASRFHTPSWPGEWLATTPLARRHGTRFVNAKGTVRPINGNSDQIVLSNLHSLTKPPMRSPVQGRTIPAHRPCLPLSQTKLRHRPRSSQEVSATIIRSSLSSSSRLPWRTDPIKRSATSAQRGFQPLAAA